MEPFGLYSYNNYIPLEMESDTENEYNAHFPSFKDEDWNDALTLAEEETKNLPYSRDTYLNRLDPQPEQTVISKLISTKNKIATYVNNYYPYNFPRKGWTESE
ncbi:MAG: hypothetical protein CMO81_05805 [Waddliaceae bacterium]|nr:hypothetical protein [Waddliaceae bacterium]